MNSGSQRLTGTTVFIARDLHISTLSETVVDKLRVAHATESRPHQNEDASDRVENRAVFSTIKRRARTGQVAHPAPEYCWQMARQVDLTTQDQRSKPATYTRR